MLPRRSTGRCGEVENSDYFYAILFTRHYEFELGPTTRLTDTEWKNRVTGNTLPPAPDWTRAYLIPK